MTPPANTPASPMRRLGLPFTLYCGCGGLIYAVIQVALGTNLTLGAFCVGAGVVLGLGVDGAVAAGRLLIGVFNRRS